MKGLIHFLGIHNWSEWSEPKWLTYRAKYMWQERICKNCKALEIKQPREILETQTKSLDNARDR